MNGLDLFSGIGGLTKALDRYVRPIAYCENDRYAQSVLLSRMADNSLPIAPIWDDVQTLRGDMLPELSIIYGGFPCQDLSCAGRGEGLDGKRSGLFFEIVRLVSEIRPRFIFLENVPAIRTRGADVVAGELAGRGYDCRWITLSAAEIGANHKRERWWLLAYASSLGWRENGTREPIAQSQMADSRCEHGRPPRTKPSSGKSSEAIHNQRCGKNVADADAIRRDGRSGMLRPGRRGELANGGQPLGDAASEGSPDGRIESMGRISERDSVMQSERSNWWAIEPDVGRVANGVPFRVDRLRALGNAVVPAQAREAFERLMGLK